MWNFLFYFFLITVLFFLPPSQKDVRTQEFSLVNFMASEGIFLTDIARVYPETTIKYTPLLRKVTRKLMVPAPKETVCFPIFPVFLATRRMLPLVAPRVC